jgi:hypothetical protein
LAKKILKKIGQWLLPIVFGVAFGSLGALGIGAIIALSPFSADFIATPWLKVFAQCIPGIVGIAIGVIAARGANEIFVYCWTKRYGSEEDTTTPMA